MSKYTDISTISELHQFYGLPGPRHPLITMIDMVNANRVWASLQEPQLFRLGFYSIYFKHFKGAFVYGKSKYDFEEGSMIFTAPQQVIAYHPDNTLNKGWALAFHPDLIHKTDLGRKINSYTYFQYDANEALHLSEDEKVIIRNCASNIQRECASNFDPHSQGLILSNLELLLGYCSRFYDRQFYTRSTMNNDFVQRFEELLKAYFNEKALKDGLPDVRYFAEQLHLSPNYLSDLLRKYTGKTTQEFIHLEMLDKAKAMLWGTEKPVSEIAYELGFEHPSHFTKIFKAKTGKSPKEYRQLN